MCRTQQNKPRSNRRSIRGEQSGETSPLRSYFFGTTTFNFVVGNSTKQEGASAKSQNKDVTRANREAYMQRTGRSVHEASAIVSRSTAVVHRGIAGAEDNHDRDIWL